MGHGLQSMEVGSKVNNIFFHSVKRGKTYLHFYLFYFTITQIMVLFKSWALPFIVPKVCVDGKGLNRNISDGFSM